LPTRALASFQYFNYYGSIDETPLWRWSNLLNGDTMNMAETLNLSCLCSTLQPELLDVDVTNARPHLFSATPVFVSAHDYEAVSQGVAALYRASALPGYQAAALARSPEIASYAFGPRGAFMGYDFHLGEHGPRLIEINTNAGGALLHASAARAHRACCSPLEGTFSTPTDLAKLDDTFMAMFREEWRTQRGDAPWRSAVIVDDAPQEQYLAPEFEMAREMFAASGIAAVVADPRELVWRDGALWHPALPAGMPVDMVYNRLTDFDLSVPNHAGLRSAYAAGAVVVTPSPRAHALHADKRNLIALSNDTLLQAWGVSCEDRALIGRLVPHTQRVTPENAESLWTQRKHLFFKPATGFGSKAAYRGDKLTRRVWGEIIEGDFVAQALVPPSERVVNVGGEATRLKVDLRAYVYDGRIQLLAARTYSGQTTNFRTPGGGFSPVVVLP
jgi:hypothetical protein